MRAKFAELLRRSEQIGLSLLFELRLLNSSHISFKKEKPCRKGTIRCHSSKEKVVSPSGFEPETY